jgi:predicted branched-subunit amino acid permease
MTARRGIAIVNAGPTNREQPTMSQTSHNDSDANRSVTVIDRPAPQVSAPVPAGRASMNRQAEIVAGIRAMLPWLVGVTPFGLMVGMTATSNGFSPAFGLATGATIYSGSAQITAIELAAGGATIGVLVLSVLAVNARLLLYGSAMAPHWRGTSRAFRVLASYLLVDPSYAVGDRRYRREPDGGHVFYVAAGVTLWLAWHMAILFGASLGGIVPTWMELGHVVPLFLLAELVGAVRTRPALGAAVVGATIAVVGADLPMHGGLLAAIVAGVTGGLVVERMPR